MTFKPLILAIETSSRLGSVALALGPDLIDHATFSAPLRHTAELLPSVRQLMARTGHRPDQIAQLHLAIGPGSFTGLRIAVAMAKAMALAAGPELKIVTVDTLDVIAANLTPDIAAAHNVTRLATVLDAKRTQFFTALYHLHHPTNDSKYEIRNTNDELPPRPQSDAKDDPALHARPKYEIRNTKYEIAVPDCLLTADQIIEQFKAPAETLHICGDGLLHHRKKFDVPGVEILPENLWSPTAVKVYELAWQKVTNSHNNEQDTNDEIRNTSVFTDPLDLTPYYLRRPEAEENYTPK